MPPVRLALPSPLLSSPLLLLLACGQMAIDGQVVNVTGQPVPGARITAIGANCATTAGEDGRYALPCLPGTYTLVVNMDGYVEQKLEVEATERKRYDQGKTVLVALPTEKGVFLFEENRYRAMEPAWLTRSIDEGEVKARRYCLDIQGSTATRLAPGSHALMDNESPGWRPFKLDEEGCAYRDQKDGRGQWVVTYKEKPEYQEQTLAAGKKVALLELPPGDYFIAHWDQGFFTTDATEKHRYTGYWLSVGGS